MQRQMMTHNSVTSAASSFHLKDRQTQPMPPRTQDAHIYQKVIQQRDEKTKH